MPRHSVDERLIRAGHGVYRIPLRYRLRTSRVIIFYQIHPVAHFEPPHQVGVERVSGDRRWRPPPGFRGRATDRRRRRTG